MLNCPYPKLKYLLLNRIDFGNIEDFLSLSQVRLNLIYLSFCNFESNDSIWTPVIELMKRVESMQTKKVKGFQFAIPNNEHTTHIVINQYQPLFDA